MLQFLIGFWSGCVSATVVLCLLYANRRRQMEDAAHKIFVPRKEEECCEGDGTEASVRVLLIDDSKLSRTVVKDFLKKYELQVCEADSGEEGLRLVRKYKYDMIFLDQCMPGMDGDETLYALRKEGGVPYDVPVVAIGSVVRKENRKLYLDKGYADCIGKPLQENRLNEIVMHFLFPEKTQEHADERPDGFSYQSGLDNFDGNETLYRETLVLFADMWEERREQLRQFLEEDNMPEYAILIHAIKGDARILGAQDFGELAYKQELQAKEGDAEAIKDGIERVITEGDKIAAYFKEIVS